MATATKYRKGGTKTYRREGTQYRKGDTKTYRRESIFDKAYRKGQELFRQAETENDVDRKLELFNSAAKEFWKAKRYMKSPESKTTRNARLRLAETYRRIAVFTMAHKRGTGEGEAEASKALRLAGREYRKMNMDDDASYCFDNARNLEERAKRLGKKLEEGGPASPQKRRNKK